MRNRCGGGFAGHTLFLEAAHNKCNLLYRKPDFTNKQKMIFANKKKMSLGGLLQTHEQLRRREDDGKHSQMSEYSSGFK